LDEQLMVYSLSHTHTQKFEASNIFKEASYAHQGCIYLLITVKQ